MAIVTSFVSSLMLLIGKLGYIGIFCVVGLEYACFPIPSEVVLPFVGMSLSQTHLTFLTSFIVSILAGLVGSSLCYAIGFWGGEPFLGYLSRRSQSAHKAILKFNHWFKSYGKWAVLLARVVPLTRTYISIFAGVSRMPFTEFILYSSVGISAWNLVLITLGFYIGDNWDLISRLLNTYSNGVLALLVIVILIIILKKYFFNPKHSS